MHTYTMTDKGWVAFRAELLVSVKRKNALAMLEEGIARTEESWRSAAEEEMNRIDKTTDEDAIIEVGVYYTEGVPEIIYLEDNWFEAVPIEE